MFKGNPFIETTFDEYGGRRRRKGPRFQAGHCEGFERRGSTWQGLRLPAEKRRHQNKITLDNIRFLKYFFKMLSSYMEEGRGSSPVPPTGVVVKLVYNAGLSRRRPRVRIPSTPPVGKGPL